MKRLIFDCKPPNAAGEHATCHGISYTLSVTQRPTDPLIGYSLSDRYAIHSRIARGGMAVVYRGVDTRLHREVAIKVMHAHLAEDPDFRLRFEQEARNTAGLNHPNLVNIYDQGEEDGYVYLVMEYLPGITLRDLLKQQQRLTPDQALEISAAILSGLARAHAEGMIHRDLKPENVLLADDGRIKLGDFGLARAANANTMTGQALLGTIAYLSPELVTRGVADTRSDVYAFGIMLFEMLTGQQPFQGEQPMQIAYQHANDEVPVPSSITGARRPDLDQIVSWATQKDPDQRPKDAAELLRRLEAVSPAGGDLDMTRVLTDTDVHLDATMILDSGGSPPVSAPGGPEPLSQERPDEELSQVTPSMSRTIAAEVRRMRRGSLLFLTTLILAGLAGGLGFWFGQGPGSLVTVPNLIGEELSEAEAALHGDDFSTVIEECSHLSIPAGHVTAMTPEPGSRVERESSITLCTSTGPELLTVPPLVGLTLAEAIEAIQTAGFTFGSVVDERFTGEPKDTVLAALNESGESLGDTHPEQAEVNLVISVGPVPDVSGLSVEEANQVLEEAGLVVDASSSTEAHSEEIPSGTVLGVNFSTDPVRPADSVSLHVSLGPELFAIPDVNDRTVKEAIRVLTEAGFTPTTAVPEAFQGAVHASGTTPETGTMVPRGTEITVHPRFFD